MCGFVSGYRARTTARASASRSGDTPLHAPSLPASSRRYAPPCFVGGIQPSRLATCTTAHPPNRATACHSARHSARRSASSLHVKPLQATPTVTNRLYHRRQAIARQIRRGNSIQTGVLQRFRGVCPRLLLIAQSDVVANVTCIRQRPGHPFVLAIVDCFIRRRAFNKIAKLVFMGDFKITVIWASLEAD